MPFLQDEAADLAVMGRPNFAQTTKTSAIGALEIQILAPVSR